ncbi:MAG: glycerol acyltransferase [Prevotellaceae bacterium]|nr:glycerol acyltransferase [Candidatus Minthosoma caballi]
MASEGEEFKVDIDKILSDKLGNKAKFVPRPIVTWLKNILHQDWMNVHLCGKGKGQIGVDWLDGCLEYLNVKINVQTNINGVVQAGLDAIPGNEDGRYYTIVCNHPLGGQDGIALGSIVCHKFDSQMVYLVNDILMNFKGLAPLCVPINKTGKNSRNFPQMVETAFQSPKNVVMFPAGLCSRRQDDGSICDLEWKKTFISKTVQYKRDVLPVHFSGQNSDKFYNIARWCKRLNIKFNFAMLYLADEMYKNQGKTFTVTFGEPIPWQTFDKSKTPIEWAQWVKDKVYNL